MNNIKDKMIAVVGWFLAIFFILISFGGLLQGYILSSLIMAIASLLLIPSIRRWFLQKTHHKFTSKAVVWGSIATIIASLGFSTPSQPTANQSSKAVVAQPVATSKPITPSVSAPPLTPPITTQAAKQTTKQVTPISATITADNVSCKVVGVSDGDTLTCLNRDNTQIKVRLNQIDAPEKSQAFGNNAKQALSGYVFGKMVSLKTSGTDKYGRTIAEVYLGDKNINKAMVADGYAWAYREYMKDNEYGDLETSARSATKGLWSEPNPIYPSDFRRGKRGEQTAPVQTQEITQQVERKAIVDSGGSCGSKRYCKEMATCAEARHYLNDCGVSRLDRDGDGVPCESICN